MIFPSVFATNVDYFVRCAEHSSFVEAARYLGITQPALSKAIQNLEEALGVKLFERMKKGIRLTPKGKALYAEFSAEFRRINERVLSIVHSSFKLRLRIGSTPHFAVRYLFPYLEKLKGVEIDQVYTDGSTKCREAVQEGKLHFAFCALTERPRDLESIFIKDDPIAIVGLRSKFAHIEKARSIEDLASEPWLDNLLAPHEWNLLTHPTRRTYIANESFSANHLILQGYAICMCQLDFFTPSEQALLARAPFTPTGNSPARGFFPPEHPPKIYLVYRAEGQESIRSFLEIFSAIGK